MRWFRTKSRSPVEEQRRASLLSVDALNGCRAAELRAFIRQTVTANPGFLKDQWPDWEVKLRDANWSESEISKAWAYAAFDSGANESGYERVLSERLAVDDFHLLMTACVQCYLVDRHVEGSALLRQFNPQALSVQDCCEYHAFAGYMEFAAGAPIEAALKHFDEALAIGCSNPLMAVNALPIYFEAGRLVECVRLSRLVRDKYPDDPDALYALACVELARDYYPEGFRQLEVRFRMPEVGRSTNRSLLAMPRWNGQATPDMRLLVHCEQGLGDHLMMARYLPLLHQQGLQLLMDVRPELLSLMQTNFPFVRLLPGPIQQNITEPFDAWTGIMSLPWHLGTTHDTVPARSGYLTAPSDGSAYWLQRVVELCADDVLKVGIAWSGNPAHRADRRRSIPMERLLPFLRSSKHIRFFTLQTEPPPIPCANLIDVSDELLTLADTAALIKHLDVVLTVDTSVVHLAGALGKKTLLILPCRYEWRWGLEGEGNAWYSSVQVIRQPIHGDWESVLQIAWHRLEAYGTGVGTKDSRA